MSMKLGERLQVTLFGESHGRCVGTTRRTRGLGKKTIKK
jgi:chorismate synthase